MLNVNIALPSKNAPPRTKRFEAVIDSGASRCIFHASIGRFIGLEIEEGTVEETSASMASLATTFTTSCSLHRVESLTFEQAFRKTYPSPDFSG